MEKEITIYHVIVLEITKHIVYGNYTQPEAVANTFIKEMYSFKTLEEAAEKVSELAKDIPVVDHNKRTEVLVQHSKLEL